MLLIVGGSLLAWHGLRESTVDVDTVRRLDQQLVDAATSVAEVHGIQPNWLNDWAAGFAPATLLEADCDVLLDHPRLRVLGSPLSQVFVMKLYRMSAQDVDDMARIWPLAGFGSAEEAESMFWHAYPHAPPDPYLVEAIRAIAKRSD